jgi:hypothetical protein
VAAAGPGSTSLVVVHPRRNVGSALRVMAAHRARHFPRAPGVVVPHRLRDDVAPNAARYEHRLGTTPSVVRHPPRRWCRAAVEGPLAARHESSNGERAEQRSQASTCRAASSSAVTASSELASDSPPRRAYLRRISKDSVVASVPAAQLSRKTQHRHGQFSANNDAHPRHIRSGKNRYFLRIADIIGVSDESDRDRVRKKDKRSLSQPSRSLRARVRARWTV